MTDLSHQYIVNRSYSGNEGAGVWEITKWVLLTAFVVAILASAVSIRNQILSFRYQIEEIQQSNRKLAEQNDMLRVELNSLTAPAVVERAAADRGLVTANDARVVLINSENTSVGTQLAQADNKARILLE